MPITDTLQNARRIEDKGLTPEVSQDISDIVEKSVQAGQQDLKGFTRNEMVGMETRLVAKIEEVRAEGKAGREALRHELTVEIRDNRVEMHSLARDQSLKFFAIGATMITLATAIIKLFPNAY